ncbi:MAG: ribosomal RNA small subunit methyltransferase A [Clostridiales bacterium]|nr:ribosomal RNA small subunit methyltransferase A [Clostridiales bacterium]
MLQDRLDHISSKGFLPESRFGQNFLSDEVMIGNIIDLCEIKPEDHVLEIGPGLGSLSVPLSELTSGLTVVEIDKRLASYIKDDLKLNAHIITSDYLKLKDYGAEDIDVVVSNLPYYVMTDIMKKLFAECVNARKMVFMVEEDALQRIYAKEGTKQYGPLSVLVSLYGPSRKEFTVPRECFVPAPNTTSCVISLTRGDIKLSSGFVGFLNKAFAMRRKKLVNNVKETAEYLPELGLPTDVRAEQLSPETLYKLYNAIISNTDKV